MVSRSPDFLRLAHVASPAVPPEVDRGYNHALCVSSTLTPATDSYMRVDYERLVLLIAPRNGPKRRLPCTVVLHALSGLR